jgi:hydroxyacylglutathione hydrolase
MCGYLCGGINEWQEAGNPITTTGTMSALDLKNKLEKGEVEVLDVREPNEWKEDGIIEGAKRIHFADLIDKTGSLTKDKPIAATCSVGNRASTAASILEKAGYKNVSNVLGGMTAWTNLGYPTRK